MGPRLGRVTKAGATGFRSLQLHYSRLGPSRKGRFMVPAVDAFINFQHFRSCNVGEYASVNTNLYIRTEGALSCMLSPASILQSSRSGSSPKLQHDKRCFEAVSFSRMQGVTIASVQPCGIVSPNGASKMLRPTLVLSRASFAVTPALYFPGSS